MRHALAAGWLAGITAILAGWPAVLALALPVLATAGAFVWARWGGGVLTGLKLAVQLKRLIKRAVKSAETTGGTVERV